ncbi:methylated-DNA--[protein]-cysteine S-methyltransferase [Bacillus salacetis]|uniref:Methylated-DNA--protein-cysteine methyltransferase n=1 Tax=Bacillus salacetis TaxID=2315464 RepID=A0A3A1R108_9BACI|nr:methylated-DNA--[protein]-cysteine S-methyltransferase [Bacillus salacetis]RIW34627.1 methylated-DNA--[protein]-cysteine S-methyltransferase [Bacillus salacetis]
MNDTLYHAEYKSPIGLIEISSCHELIRSIEFTERTEKIHLDSDEIPEVLKRCLKELDEYFKGRRFEFTFPYTQSGTGFQLSVWDALTKISYAETASYKDIAASIGNEKAIRAVGSANGRNKLSIVVPCHRIIGSNGKLTGYAGGIERKEWLLQHERNCYL